MKIKQKVKIYMYIKFLNLKVYIFQTDKRCIIFDVLKINSDNVKLNIQLLLGLVITFYKQLALLIHVNKVI